MVEDDPLFAKVFAHFWNQVFPLVKVRLSGSLKAMSQEIESALTPPSLVILDHNLPDGLGSEVSPTLPFTNLCWSALGDGELRRKPQGRKELEEAVQELGRLAGLQ